MSMSHFFCRTSRTLIWYIEVFQFVYVFLSWGKAVFDEHIERDGDEHLSSFLYFMTDGREITMKALDLRLEVNLSFGDIQAQIQEHEADPSEVDFTSLLSDLNPPNISAEDYIKISAL